MWDVFISHASEDKDFVRELAHALKNRGLTVWFDEMTLKLGDRLGESIDRGLAESHFGIVVFSPAFFQKPWPRYELEGLVNREMAHGKTILPIWHQVSLSEVARFSPSLANKMAVSTDRGIEYVVSQIMEVVAPESGSSAPSLTTKSSEPYTRSAAKGGYTHIDQVHLRNMLVSYFNLSELQDLCFDLGIYYENLPGQTISDKARELIAFMNRRGELPKLVTAVKSLRRHVNL